MAGWVQTPPPARWPSPHVSCAISQPSSCGRCGMVLNTHLIAPVVASVAITRPPGMWPSESAAPAYSVPSWYAGAAVMR